MRRRLLTTAAACALCALVLAWLSSAPGYRHVPPRSGLLRLSMIVAGARVAPCRDLTAAEIAQLAANMRQAQSCPRERADVRILLWINDAIAVDAIVSPRGLARDGAATIYRRIVLPAGSYQLRVAVNDDERQSSFRYDVRAVREIRPGQVLTVDFDREAGGVTFR